MQKIKSLIILFFAVILLLCPLDAYAAAGNITIHDEADLLSPSEEEELYDYLESLDDSINYYIVTSDAYNSSEISSRLDRLYSTRYNNSDGSAFIIDMYNRELFLKAYGSTRRKLSKADALDITDNTYKYASKGQYYDCILKIYEQADSTVHLILLIRPMRYLICFFLAIIIGFLVTFYTAIVSRINGFKSAKSSQILATGVAITSTPVIYNTIKRIHNSDSGGGSSGGGCGGGCSSCGGGHSF